MMLRYFTRSRSKRCRVERSPRGGEKAVGKLTFVLAPDDTLYVAEKTRGHFHHSSFLSGSVATAAGSMVVAAGKLELTNPHSGQEDWDEFSEQRRVYGHFVNPLVFHSSLCGIN